jgi:spore coat polysaccharide biosynthesis predicted glycosyltransferase SpsG
MNKNKIAFLTCASKKYGLGHLIRLKILENKLKLKKNIWIVLGEKHLIKQNLKNKKIFHIPDLDYQKINLILKKNKISKIIMDLSNNDTLRNNKLLNLQEFLRKKLFRLISFDLPQQTKIVSQISIMPFLFKKNLYRVNDSKIFIGYNYIFTEKIKINKNNKPNNKILIVIGGTDPLGIGIKVYNMIKHLPYSFKVILGENNFINKQKRKNASFIKFTNNILKDINNSQAVICGEGNIKFLSILALKPTILIQQFDTKSEMIKDFLRRNVTFSLGIFSKIKKKNLSNKIQNYLNNDRKIKRNIINIKKHFNYEAMQKKQKILINEIKKI